MPSFGSRNIVIAHDYRNGFESKRANVREFCSLDTKSIANIFKENGWTAEVVPLNRLPLIRPKAPVLLTSSEDRFGLYKSFVESVAIGLEAMGGVCLPRSELINAHHNKLLMEQLKSIWIPGSEIFETQYFGTYEDVSKFVDNGNWPKVLKTSAGGGSMGVALVRDPAELRKKARRASRSLTQPDTALELIARRRRKGYVPRSLHRQGFIVQEFITNISGEYKVLVYGNRYYVIQRFLRPNEFRGSNIALRLEFNLALDPTLAAVLDFACLCHRAIRAPCSSLDIVISDGQPLLLEFQCVHFGTRAAEESVRHYVQRRPGEWDSIDEPCDIERTFVEGVLNFLGAGDGRPDG